MSEGQSVYLDYNATSPLRPEARRRMMEVLEHPSNPSSVHRYGRAARAVVEQSRAKIAEAISAFPKELTFTPSGSECNNWVLRNSGAKHVLIGADGHSSIQKALATPDRIAVDANGVIDLASLKTLLKKYEGEKAIVSVMLANNETGVIQPVAEIATLCREHDALFHCDAVQALGKIPVDSTLIGADFITLSAHKCGGPVGASALVIRGKHELPPLITGGGQERNMRAGTENTAAIAAFAVAAELSVAELPKMAKLEMWMRRMEKELSAEVPDVLILGKDVSRLPNTTCIAMPGVAGEVQLMDFDLNGFAVSAGSACTSGKTGPGHVLTAMGVAPEIAKCAIRVSSGWGSKEEDVKRFTKAWLDLYRRNHGDEDAAQASAG